MGDNAALTAAKRAKKDEFYTQRVDIENELRHYKAHFKDKVVLCNCDDPRQSEFFKYFVENFEKLGLKRLIATCYKSQDVDLFSQGDCERAICQVYEGDKNGNMVLDDDEVGVRVLNGDGDFRSEECIEILKEADIVVTNPPFSLFREYVAQLVKYGKKFVIIGNQNAITYKEIFPLFKESKIWLGSSLSYAAFKVPSSYEEKSNRFWIDESGQKWRSMGNICWFTNLDIPKRHENLILYKHYTPEEYPKFDNYDAINVDKVAEIPCDYDGVMGVPITFLDKFNPEQFEIVEFRKGNDGKDLIYCTNGGGQCDLTSEYSSVDADKWAYEQSQRYGGEWQKQVCKNSRSATSIPGMIKSSEGKIKGRITYARICIRQRKV